MQFKADMRSLGLCAAGALGAALAGCGGGAAAPTYPISTDVVTTVERTVRFPFNVDGGGLLPHQTNQIARYGEFGYGEYTLGAGLPLDPRAGPGTAGIMPAGFDYTAVTRKAKLLHFFAMSDIHQTDKESPAQLIYLQQAYYPEAIPGFGNYPWGWQSSVYSPVMLYTTHVLDAALQTVNALHKKSGNAYDFGISLGDVANSSQYNELRWFIDNLDGKFIVPSSGAHVGSASIDYQKPYQAAGLDRSIPFYSTLGNHDHNFIGSLPVNPFLREAYVSDTVLAIGDVLLSPQLVGVPQFYMGTLDGTTPYGDIINAGRTVNFASPPKVVADPDRRSLLASEWIAEWFKSSTEPVGHGFGLVEPGHGPNFACYSFVPKAGLPLKVIVLDDTQSSDDGDTNIHGHGYLDPERLAWLKAELAAGDQNNQLMIISAHVPIGVEPLGSNLEWWDNSANANTATPPGIGTQNAITYGNLIAELTSHPNLLLWISGHLHQSTVNAFVGASPELSFWEVQTSALRDYPQQFRDFELFLNSDYSVAINAVSVDPAVADGSPAAISRKYAIATQQIGQNPTIFSTDPLLIQPWDQRTDAGIVNPTIKAMPLGFSNSTLYKQLSPAMKAVMQAKFP
jgi:metallophosphoesterase (TIGR03768 family)